MLRGIIENVENYALSWLEAQNIEYMGFREAWVFAVHVVAKTWISAPILYPQTHPSSSAYQTGKRAMERQTRVCLNVNGAGSFPEGLLIRGRLRVPQCHHKMQADYPWSGLHVAQANQDPKS